MVLVRSQFWLKSYRGGKVLGERPGIEDQSIVTDFELPQTSAALENQNEAISKSFELTPEFCFLNYLSLLSTNHPMTMRPFSGDQ